MRRSRKSKLNMTNFFEGFLQMKVLPTNCLLGIRFFRNSPFLAGANKQFNLTSKVMGKFDEGKKGVSFLDDKSILCLVNSDRLRGCVNIIVIFPR